jgi:UPF0755 protein
MENKASCGLKTLIIITIILLSLILLGIVIGLATSIPTRAEEIFGPPDSQLSTWNLYNQSLKLLRSEDQLFEPTNHSYPDLAFIIQEGDSLDRILSDLHTLGIVRHPASLRAFFIYSGIDRKIQPGTYQFPAEITEIELARLLGDPLSQNIILTVLAGWRAEEIGDKLLGLGLTISPEEFSQSISEQDLEGFLFPDEYPINRTITADQLIEKMYQNFLSQITPEIENNLAAQGLSTQEGVILASIIQREAVLEEEMPLIASVFLNRIGLEMYLEADPTVQYSLGFNPDQGSWWTNPLTLEDLEISSPYNTYLYPGLPPGPICNPGLNAIKAVASPAETDYLFFRSACDNSGKHLFAETYQDHLENACP